MFQKFARNHYKYRLKNKLGPDNDPTLDQIMTPPWTRQWPLKGLNLDQIITSQQIYIYICCRVENPSKNCPFLSWKSVHFLLFFFFFFKNLLLSAGRMRLFKKIKEKRKKEKKHNFLRWKSVQLCCAAYLDGFSTQPWTDFQLNNFVNFGPFFPLWKSAETTIFIVFSANKWII